MPLMHNSVYCAQNVRRKAPLVVYVDVLSLLAKNSPFDSPDGYLLMARNGNRVQKNLQHKPLVFSPPPSVPLKGSPYSPSRPWIPPLQKWPWRYSPVWPWPFLSKFSSSCPPNLCSLLWSDPDRIFQGHLDRVLRNEKSDLVQSSNSRTWNWQETRIFCSMLFIVFSTGEFYRKPYSTLVIKLHTKNPRNKKTLVYSWIEFCRLKLPFKNSISERAL